jgi:hypothetical protein
VAHPSVEVREAGDPDTDAILALAGRSLGWAGDERDRAFFRWKHRENPFGPSPSWVAVLDGEVVGFRTFLRWELAPPGGTSVRMVRAVDTATDPANQGRGIFRTLTLGAVDALTAAGVDAVFNTPNAQSRPGYLKMGWSQLGRPTLGVIARSPVPVLRAARSREGAEKWPRPLEVGVPAAEALADPALPALLRSLPPPPERRWATPLTPEHLRWRYAFEPLGYRAVEVRDGLCVLRARRRGRATEVAICAWLAPGPDPRGLHRAVRSAGDYGVCVGLGLRDGALPAFRQGPVVTWRPLSRPGVPGLDDVAFTLGDLELF